MDTPLWPQQQVGSLEREMEQVATQNNTISRNISANDPTNNAITAPMVGVDQRRARPQKDQNLNCPRCNSTNTKFCYYNNYSLTQPRYFCKTCRRYWTQGGSLRNVPVGGGSRKNRRSSISSASSSPSSTLASTSSPSMITSTIPTLPSKMIPDLNPPSSFSHLITPSHQNPKFLEGQDLNLGFPIQGFFQPLDHQHQLPKIEASNNNNNNNVTNNENHEPINMINGNIPNVGTTTSCTTTTTSSPSCGGNNNNNNSTSISALELLRNGIASKGNLNSFVPIPIPGSNTLYPSSGFSNLQEVKPNIGVFASSGDHHHHHHHHHGNGYDMIGSGANVGGAARLLFPFADMNKLTSSTPTHHHDIDDHQHKGRNDHHHHHQGPTSGYWTGMLGGGTW